VNSGQRVQSKEQIQPFQTVKRGPVVYHQKSNGGKPKSGFTIASTNDEDEDEWVSSESGAATPSRHDSDTDESDDDACLDDLNRQLGIGRSGHPSAQVDQPFLPRVDTARPSDYIHTTSRHERHGGHPPTLSLSNTHTAGTSVHVSHLQMQNSHHPDFHTPLTSPARRSPHPSHIHHSTRPLSTHSVARSEQPLRPHPLIRGNSYGLAQPLKPTPLAPLTVIPDSGTPSTRLTDSSDQTISISPESGTSVSPTMLNAALSSHRRTSVSSARSVATLPSHSREPAHWSLGDRKRTLSTISRSSSSAALSSLTHLPAVTRPPSPQQVAFFPPINPHANVEMIHPLLPGPYLNNHLTVLARRNPIKESFDRVIQARQAQRVL
jgi:hypothetical protein